MLLEQARDDAARTQLEEVVAGSRTLLGDVPEKNFIEAILGTTALTGACRSRRRPLRVTGRVLPSVILTSFSGRGGVGIEAA